MKSDPNFLPSIASPLPHSLYDPEDGVELCLFVTDDSVEKIKAKLIELRVGGFTKVMSVTTLRKKYHEFAARRALVARYAAFFADKRVVPMMPKLCGKPFFSRRKQPMPVEVAHGDLAAALSEVRDSTYLTLGAQTVSIKIGRAHMPPSKVAANIVAAIEPAVARLPGKWKGVKSIYLRGVDTVSAPLYRASNADIEAAEAALAKQSVEGAAKAAQGAGKAVADEFFGDQEEEEEEEVVKAAPQKKTKGAKDSAAASADNAKNVTKAAPVQAGAKQQLASTTTAAAVGGKRPRPATEPSEVPAVAAKKQVSSAAAKPAPDAVPAPAVAPAAASKSTAVKTSAKAKTSAPSAKVEKPASKKAQK